MSPERVKLAGLLLLFVAGLWPFMGTFLLHYVDERNYTNAAITMARTGDYLTPRWPDGEPRLHKPILAYWAVAAGHALLGTSPAASRLFFLLAGAATIALTYRLALAMTHSENTALLAATVAFSQPGIILGSIRSIPDVLLCLFMLLSAWGFVSVIVLERRSPGAYWAAYVGAGLAVATKGMLPLAFVAFAWLFVLLDRTAPARRWRTLVHLPSMLAAVAVAGWWYALMYSLHGSRLVRVFWHDQVTGKVQANFEPLYHIPVYVALLLVNLLPWSLAFVAIAFRDRSRVRPEDVRARRGVHFIALWSLLVAVIFALGPVDSRYILPAGPLLAVLLAAALGRAEPALTHRVLGWLLTISLALLVALGAGLAVLRAVVTGPLPALGLLTVFLAVAATLHVGARDPHRLSPATALALAVFLAFPLTAIALEPVLTPDAGVRTLAKALDRPRPDPSQPILLIAHRPEGLAGKLRLATAGRVAIDTQSRLSSTRADWPDAMILSAPEAAKLDLTGYRTRAVSTEVRRIPVRDLARAIGTGRLVEVLDGLREHYLLAIRR